MPNPKEDSIIFIESNTYAIKSNFGAISDYSNELNGIREELKKIDRVAEIERDFFIHEGQWSYAANYHHAQYIERMKRLNERREELGEQDQDHIRKALIRIGATEEALATIAGSILQFGKKILSYRYGPKGNLPNTRNIATIDLTEIIWEGRNHSMHWEENNPRAGVTNLLTTLQNETGITFPSNENNAFKILELIEWDSPDDMINEMKSIM